MSKIDPKIRAIYHLMLNDKIFITDPSWPGGSKRFVWTHDLEVAKEITSNGTENMDALQIARILVSRLKEKSNEVN